MDRHSDILAFLDAQSLRYWLHRHAPMQMIEDCQHIEGVNYQQAAMPKNVFLCNRQQTQFYLVLLRHDLSFRTAVVSKLLSVSRLSFASPDWMEALLQLSPGAVSPLNLMFDQDQRVSLAMDRKLLDYERLLFHPGNNTLSVEMATDDFLHGFLPAIGRSTQLIDLSAQQEGDR